MATYEVPNQRHKHQGANPTFYGPFDTEQQAYDWAEGARKAWTGVTTLVFALVSPWDA